MALTSVKVTQPTTIVGGTVPSAPSVRSAKVTVPGQINLTVGTRDTTSPLTASATATDSLGRTGVLESRSVPTPALAQIVSVSDEPWGAKGDAQEIADGAITSGTNVVSSATASWKVGQVVVILGAGANVNPGGTAAAVPGPLTGYVTNVAGTAATLMTASGGATPANASHSVTGATFRYGTDDTAAIQAAVDATSVVGTRIMLKFAPGRRYLYSTITPKSSVWVWMFGSTHYLIPTAAGPGGVGKTGLYFLYNQPVDDFRTLGGHFPGTGVEDVRQSIVYTYEYSTPTEVVVAGAKVKNWSTSPWSIRSGSRVKVQDITADDCCVDSGNNCIDIVVPSGAVSCTDFDVSGVDIGKCASFGVNVLWGGGNTLTTSRAFFTKNNIEAQTCISLEMSSPQTGTAVAFEITGNILRGRSLDGLSGHGVSVAVFNGSLNPEQLGRVLIQTNIIDSVGDAIQCSASDATIDDNDVNVTSTNGSGLRLVSEAYGDFTATTANGSTAITGVAPAAGVTLAARQPVSGAGITPGTYLVSGSGANWTLSRPATTNGTVTLTALMPIPRVTASNNTLKMPVDAAHNAIHAYGLIDSQIHHNPVSYAGISTGGSSMGWKNGVYAESCGWTDIKDNPVTNAITTGIFTVNCNALDVDGNRVYNPIYWSGIRYINTANSTFNDNKVTIDYNVYNPYGIDGSDAASFGNKVRGNEVRGVPSQANAYFGLATSCTHISDNYSDGSRTVTAAGSLTVPAVGDGVWTVSGATAITNITVQPADCRATLLFTGAGQVTNGSNLKMAGNFVPGAAGGSISFVSDGTNWRETNRAVYS